MLQQSYGMLAMVASRRYKLIKYLFLAYSGGFQISGSKGFGKFLFLLRWLIVCSLRGIFFPLQGNIIHEPVYFLE